MKILTYLHENPAMLLIIGDLLNLAGGIWLATDLLWKEKEIKEQDVYDGVLFRPGTHNFKVEVEGRTIETPDDVKIVFVRRKARAASYACALLLLGFVMLLIGHIIEARRD